MSRREEITVTCPKCGTEHPFVIWPSINTTLNPDMKAAVKDLSAFQFECPSCGEKTYVDYGCLYHQMEDRIMIQYANSDKSAEQCYEMMTRDGPTGILQDMRKNGYLLRIVRSQRELLEKIAVFDAGLDDRIIEICKVFILAAFHEGNPDCGEIETLYFRDDDKNLVQIIADGEAKGVAEIPDAFYEELCQEYDGKIPDMRKDDPCIDRYRALQMMGLR